MSIGKGILIGVLSLIIFAVILIAAFFVYLRFFEKPGNLAMGRRKLTIPPFWTSKAFWVNAIVIAIMIDQYIQSWPQNPVSWIFWEGLILAVLNNILVWLQNQTIKYLRKISGTK